MYIRSLDLLANRKWPLLTLLILLVSTALIYTGSTRKTLFPSISAPSVSASIWIPNNLRSSFKDQLAVQLEEQLEKEKAISSQQLFLSNDRANIDAQFKYGYEPEEATKIIKTLISTALGGAISQEEVFVYSPTDSSNGAFFIKFKYPENFNDEKKQDLNHAFNTLPQVKEAHIIGKPSVQHQWLYRPIAGFDNASILNAIQDQYKNWIYGDSIADNHEKGSLKEAEQQPFNDWLDMQGDLEWAYTNQLEYKAEINSDDTLWVDEQGPAELIYIVPTNDADLLETEAAITSVFDRIGITDYIITTNPAATLRDSFSNIYQTLSLAALALFMLLLLMMRDFRRTLVVIITLPISLILTSALLLLNGTTLNLIMLGAISLAIGIAVDSAVVVTHIIHKSKKNQRPIELKRVYKPLALGTLTNILAFTPLILISEGPIALLGELVSVMVLTCLFSWICSMYVLPIFISGSDKADQLSDHSALEPKAAFGIRSLTSVNHFMLRHPSTLLIFMVIIIAGCGYSVYYLSKASYLFFEQPDSNTYIYGLDKKEAGFDPEGYKRLQTVLQTLHQENPGLLDQTLIRWSKWQTQFFITSENKDYLKKLEERLKSELTDEFTVIYSTPFVPSSIDFRLPPEQRLSFSNLSDDEYHTLGNWLDLFKPKSEPEKPSNQTEDGTTTQDDNEPKAKTNAAQVTPFNELTPRPDPQLNWKTESFIQWEPMALSQLTSSERDNLKSYLKLYWENATIGYKRKLGDRESYTFGLSESISMDELFIPINDDFVPLRYLISLDEKESLDTRVISKGVDTFALNFNALTHDQKDWIDQQINVLGFSPSQYGWVNPREEVADLLDKLGVAAIGATLIMLLVSYFFYNQFTCGLLVASISCVSAIIAAALSTWVDTKLTMGVCIGALLLIGLSVNNLFLLFDSRINAPKQTRAALEYILNERALPIIYTTLTTLVCSIPLVYSDGLESSFLRPIGMTLIFGMLVSSFLSLCLYPAIVYKWVRSQDELSESDESLQPANENMGTLNQRVS